MNLNRVHIAVRADFKINIQRITAVIIGIGTHIVHALSTVDAIFNNLRDGLIDDACICAGIVSVDVNCGRRDIRILRYRRIKSGDYSYKTDYNCNYDGENRAVNKKFSHILSTSLIYVAFDVKNFFAGIK